MKRAVFITCLIILTNIAAYPQSVNLEQARVLVLANSRSLARYEMALRSSILDERNQLYTMMPQVSADYRAAMSFFRNWEFVNPAEAFSAGASFSISQIIFQGGKSFINRAISKIATESVKLDALAEYFNVLDAADNAYYAVLEAKASLEAEESSLTVAILGLSIAEVLHSSGMINPGDYLRAMAEKESRENSRNQSRRNYTMMMNRFKTLAGITETAEPEEITFAQYEDVIRHLAAISDERADALYGDFRNILLESNPSLAKAVLNTSRAEKSFTLTKRDYAPTISASIFSSDFSFLPEYNSTGSSGVSIRGTIPVDFWVMNNRIERSRISRDMSLLEFENTQNNLEQELQNALLNMFSQAGSVLSSRRSLEYTQSNFEYVMERYRLMQSSVSDLNEATSMFINSRNSLNRASYSFLQSLSRLRSLCALDDEEKLLEILMRE